jgi:hypothetical protein
MLYGTKSPFKELFEGSKSKLPDSPYWNLKLEKAA